MWWKRHPLIAGAITLFLSGLFTRAVGTIYRIFLVRSAGEEVLGLFQMTLPLYRVALTLATLGLPVAIARLAAEASGRGRDHEAARYQHVGLTLTLYSAVIVAIGLIISSDFLATTVLTDPRTRLPLLIIGLLLIPSSLAASYRGALQGKERMVPIAASSAVEAVVRSPVVLYFVALLMPFGAAWGASAIVLGLTVGELFSLFVLIWALRQIQKSHPGRWSTDLSTAPWERKPPVRFHLFDHIPVSKRLLRLGLPVSASGLLNNLLSLASVAMIPRRLALAGFAMEEAVKAYGRLSGMALPLLYMPMVAIHPIIQVTLPSVSSRIATGGTAAVRPLIRKSFAVALGIGGLASMLFAMFPTQLSQILYGVSDLDPLVRPLAIAAPFAYIGHVASGILYGLGRTRAVMTNSVIGNTVRLVLVWHLGAQPALGIYGVLIGSLADYVVTAVLNLITLFSILRRASA